MEDTATSTTARQYPEDYLSPALGRASQVHSIETTANSVLPENFATIKREKLQVELEAAKKLYNAIDTRDNTHKAYDLEECRKYAWFTRHKETGNVKVIANACRLRWCPICAEARRMQIKHAVSDWIKTLKKPKFLTLTVKHADIPLAPQIDRLYKQFRVFRTHKFLKQKVRGGVWFFQVKRSSKTQEWHPHLHVILDSDYIDKIALSTEWNLTTGDSFIVDIRAISDPGKVADYVSRYAASPCKMSDFSEDDGMEIATVLHGKRLCGRFGSAASCRFKTEKPVDFDRWEKIGSWTDIVLNCSKNSRFRAVVKAWSTNSPLDAEIAAAIRVENGLDVPALSTPEPAKPNPQYFFEELIAR